MSKPMILVVEEEPALGRLLARLLKREQLEVEVCELAGEAIQRLAKGGVDLVMADFELSDRNGALLLAEVRNLYPSVKRVLLSGVPDSPAVAKAIQQGDAEALIPKPWNQAALLGALRNLLPKA